jgi:hypothetical protein
MLRRMVFCVSVLFSVLLPLPLWSQSDESQDLHQLTSGTLTTLHRSPGPDILVKDIELNEDLELGIVLSNSGDVDLREGAVLRIRIFVNGKRVSAFDHLTADVLKAGFGNDYRIGPPYRVPINGQTTVRVSISAQSPSDDVSSDNNSQESQFVVFSFSIEASRRQGFPVPFFLPPGSPDDASEKMRVEARWDGNVSPLQLSFVNPGETNLPASVSGRSPLRMELSMGSVKGAKRDPLRFWITNLVGQKVEGCLIVQHRR